MVTLASQLGQGCDVTICSIAEALPFTSGQLQVNLLRVGATLLSHKDGNPLVGSRLLPSLLQILSAHCSAIPNLSSAASVLVSLIQALPAQPSSNAQLSGNEFWETLSLSFPDLATYVPSVDLCNQIVKDPQCTADWLTKLASTVYQISKFHYTIVVAVFLYQGSTAESIQEATKVLQREVYKSKNLAHELFPIILYRLGREPDPTTRLHLLYFLPVLAVNKLTVPMILKTLLALWSSTSLKPLVLRLLLEVWKIEPRIHSYLSQLIHDKSSSTQELEIAKAYVVAEICKSKPSQHGEEFLSLLSALLNEHRGKDGTPQTTIALDGIYELCSAVVIDLRTTWKVIGPKLVKDKRPEVIVKLCKLLSLAPKLTVRSKEYEDFIQSAANILWGWASSKIKNSVNEAAFSALEKYDPQYFVLKMLPSYAREGHKLPDKMASTPFEAARKAEDVLTYVPGLAWVKLAVGIPKPHANYVESFLKSVVERELTSLPKGIYMTAIQEAKRKGYRSSGGQPEPPSYSFLPDTSFLKAAVIFLQDFSKLLNESLNKNFEESEKLLQGIVLLLVSLGQPLNRPFPALDWSFLNEVYAASKKWDSLYPNNDFSPKIREGIFRVTAQQCNKSASALNVISKWLVPSSSLLTPQDEIYLFSLLDQLGRGLNPPTLQAFISHVLNDSTKDRKHLLMLLEALKPHLTCDYVHDSNRNVMSNAVESLNEKIDPNDETLYKVYKSCVADLPQKHIERLTSPSLWWEVTDQKLYRAAVLRCHVATKDPGKSALPWLNDMVDSAATLPGDRSHFLMIMAETLIARSETQESSAWLLSLLGRLREYLKKQPGDNLVAVHEQQQRITFYMDILVLGLMIWSGLWATCPMNKLASSALTRNSLLTASLVSLNGRADWSHTLPQLLNWLVSSYSSLSPYIGNRYEIKPPMLLLASLSTNLSQLMWNKVITMVI
ncbi:Focadhesin [Armadillidium vulgare]|nr:Focadhesin [Armadillidium vulgare]